MLTKYPNASILVLITQREKEEERLLFCLLKPVPDTYPDDSVHWYDGVGRNAKPNSLMAEPHIRQWLAIGKDQVMDGLFNDIITHKEIEIDGATLRLTFPKFQTRHVMDAALSNRDEAVTDQWLIDNTGFVPAVLFEQATWDQLSGHSPLQVEGNQIKPAGLFDQGYLYNKLNQGILAVKEHRTPYLTFRGVRSSSIKGEGSREVIGFYQQQFDPSATYTATIRNASGEVIGSSEISQKTGRFHIKPSEPVIKGVIEVHRDRVQERVISFSLIQDIHLAIVSAKSFTDAYGRTFLVNSKETRSRPSVLVDSTWTKAEYLDHATAVQNLSDMFKLIFDHLGPHVLIADPYFLGPIKTLPDGTEPLSHDQEALINAWVHSSVEYPGQRLTVLGSSKIYDLTQAALGSTKSEEVMDRYQRTFGRIINGFKHEHSPSLRFLRSTEFHNRYWFSVTDKEGLEHLDKCIIVTNSVGNIRELDVVVVTDQDQLAQIRRRFHGLYANAEECLAI